METIGTLKKETLNGLQDLIEINRDSAAGFKTVAEHVPSADVASLFREIADERSRFANELAAYVRVNDEMPVSDGSWKARAHRWWIDLRSKLTDDDLEMVLEEAERGEDKIKALYEQTLKEIPGNPLSSVMHRQYARVKQVHDQIRDSRNLVQAVS